METPHDNAAPPGAGEVKAVRRHYAKGVSGALLLIIGFSLGVLVSDLRAGERPADGASGPGTVVNRDAGTPSDLPEEIDFNAYWNVWDIVKRRFVTQPVSDMDLFYGSIAGMVGALDDPYSVFFDPELAQRFEDDLAGTFEGIGAEIGIKKDQLTVVAPLDGTPADRAGLKAGDKIIAIDGEDTYGILIDEAVNRIRGPKGTDVTLLVIRDGEPDAREIVITRDTIVVEAVKASIEERAGGRYGVIKISHFNETTGPKFNAAVQEMLLEDPDGLVLDLRNNPGGYLDTAVQIAGEWIQQDVVVSERFSDGSTRNYNSDGNARFADMRTVVLVNGGSASASEIVAGALQDHGKAVVIGEQTYGKGSVQDYVEFDDGAALKLTIALWLTPDGRSIDQEGIAPDETVELTEEDFDEDRDPQIERAFEILAGSPVRPDAPKEAAE